jgi:hypothetical protein
MTCSFRTIRGRTAVACILDEVAFWRVDGANPDKEILAAIRPSMVTIPTSMLLVCSSPYARSGVLYEAHKDYYGKDDSGVLVWQAATRVMNPTIPQKLIAREAEKDPSAARAEWWAEFRDDIEDFLSLEAIQACCVLPGELARHPYVAYRAFVDPSGGRADAFTLAIGHRRKDTGKYAVDSLRGWKPPFNPDEVVAEIVEGLRRYGVNTVTGDRYAASWVSSSFEKHKIRYEHCAKVKSELYLDFEGFVNTGRVELPESERLVNELVSLERRRGRSGRDIIDHPPRGSDDHANAVAGLCHILDIGAGSAFSGCDLS